MKLRPFKWFGGGEWRNIRGREEEKDTGWGRKERPTYFRIPNSSMGRPSSGKWKTQVQAEPGSLSFQVNTYHIAIM